MKLKVTDWRHAWFESHISDRFFQEMARLEKGSIQALEMSAQWMEQIMIETGALAQAMIRLEQNGAPEPQIKLAYEKALRLAALCMHLITALDGADRAQLRSSVIAHHEPGLPGRSPLPTPAYPQPGPVRPLAQPVPDASAGDSIAPVQDGAAPLLHPLARGPALLRPANGPEPRPGDAPPPGMEQEPSEPEKPHFFNPLLQIAGRPEAHPESEMHQTIRSLSEQGLSRAEIELVTGEPRHVIEAVLNHARTQTLARADAEAQPT